MDDRAAIIKIIVYPNVALNTIVDANVVVDTDIVY